jgi:hypothetical protein
VKSDKVRKLYTGQIVELHGLVSAYKLNGQLAECLEFDVELQRYVVLLKSGETKKVQPQNLVPIGKFRSEMINVLQLKALNELNKSPRSEVIATLSKWLCVVPNVVSARVMADWAKLESADLRKRLIASKKVPISTIPDDVSVVLLSLSRPCLTLTDIETQEPSLIKQLRDTLKTVGPVLEDDILRNQVYWILPFDCLDSLELPMINRALRCSYPAWSFLADAIVLALDKGQETTKNAFQRLDLACASKASTQVYLSQKGSPRKREMKISLPSRGDCDESELKYLREVEKALSIQKLVDEPTIIQCQSI